tara:strand:+ start:109 stop:252 length:144 start_codon:yes stop_codon:yes gene_type:complete
MLKRIGNIASSQNILLKAGEKPKEGYFIILDEVLSKNMYTIDFEVVY